MGTLLTEGAFSSGKVHWQDPSTQALAILLLLYLTVPAFWFWGRRLALPAALAQFALGIFTLYLMRNSFTPGYFATGQLDAGAIVLVLNAFAAAAATLWLPVHRPQLQLP